jgi:hypothetical protein
MLSIVLFICSALLIAWAYFMPPKENASTFSKYFRAIIFWVVFLVWFFFSIYEIVDKEGAKEVEKNELRDERDSLKSQLDSIKQIGKNTAGRLDSLQPHTDTVRIQDARHPIISPCPIPDGSKALDSGSRYKLVLKVCNLGEISATNVQFVLYYIWDFAKPHPYINQGQFKSQPASIAPNNGNLIITDYLPKFNPPVGRYFIYLRVSYSDEYHRSYEINRFVFVYDPASGEDVSLTGAQNFNMVERIVRKSGAW